MPKLDGVNRTGPVERKFWSRVNFNGPVHPIHGQCWLWTGFRMKSGYGQFSCGVQLRCLAHRFAYTLEKGPIPEEQNVCHSCDNPACVNPAHLFAGTQQDNLEDMRNKGHQVRGETCSQSILTEEQVQYIRSRYRRYSHQHGCGAIAKDLGVSLIAVFKALKGITWRHVV